MANPPSNSYNVQSTGGVGARLTKHSPRSTRYHMLTIIKFPDVFTNIGATNARMTLDTHIVTKRKNHLRGRESERKREGGREREREGEKERGREGERRKGRRDKGREGRTGGTEGEKGQRKREENRQERVLLPLRHFQCTHFLDLLSKFPRW